MLAKLAAPGMCNPDDDTAVVDGAPCQDGIDRDSRSAAQRNHDALNAGLRALLASGELGQHNGLRPRSSSPPPWPTWKPPAGKA